MSLSAWEGRALNSIKDGLAGSDPELAALLVMFDRLESGEEMPARENVRPVPRSSARHSFRIRLHLSPQHVALVLWLTITIAVIAVGAELSHAGGPSGCTTPLAAVCSGPTPTHRPSPAAHTEVTARPPTGTPLG